ncbi:MAG: carboxypeptidase-like regulatory domain-containing protein [Planctomycetaceae bacterium]|jgi:hypothetical protein|nr:carboxypeptidase-like regulatory domain-containing protein [Planctomycetaceae bacterium]
MMSLKISYLLLPFLVLLNGCYSGNVKVHGTVLFPDGQPLTKGIVVFQSETHVAKGTLDNSGKFVLSSVSIADGIPPGIYKVFITLASIPDKNFVPPPNEPDAMNYISLIADQYTSAEKTPLTCEIIKSGTQRFTVEPPLK